MGVVAVLLILRISQRFKRPLLVFKYPRREGMVSISLFFVLLIFALTIRGYVSGYYFARIPLPVSSEWKGNLALALVSLLLVALALYLRRQPIRSTGWNKIMLAPSLRLSLALMFLTIFLRNKVASILNGILTEEGWALALLLVICLCEETFFRGYIYPRLSCWLGKNYGWVASAVLFALWRVLMTPAIGNIPVIEFAFFSAQGLLLGWIMNKSGHVITSGLYRTISEWLWALA